MIRRNADWRRVFDALGLTRDERKSRVDDWWASSPLAEDNDPSFHINDGGWYCFSSGEGGGILELIQKAFDLDCYAAARWLLENGCSHLEQACGNEALATSPSGERKNREARHKEPKSPNKPIRQNLVPALSTEHPELERRGISPATCTYLGCGAYGDDHKGPLAGRIVFQVRGVEEMSGVLQPTILTHMGRALTDEQAQMGGKWHAYAGFHKTLEIYNQDHLLLDERAIEQAQACGHIVLVEGCFDVAKLVEAGILNVGATFGAHLDEDQLPRLRQIAERTGVQHFVVWYDRDRAGESGQQKAVTLINTTDDLSANGFDWEIGFDSPIRGRVCLPETLRDPGEFTPEQLRFLREQSLV